MTALYEGGLIVGISCTIAALLGLMCAYLSTARPWMDDPAAEIDDSELDDAEDGGPWPSS